MWHSSLCLVTVLELLKHKKLENCESQNQKVSVRLYGSFHAIQIDIKSLKSVCTRCKDQETLCMVIPRSSYCQVAALQSSRGSLQSYLGFVLLSVNRASLVYCFSMLIMYVEFVKATTCAPSTASIKTMAPLRPTITENCCA